MNTSSFEQIIREAAACQLCASDLPHGVRPVFSIHPKSRIIVIGQAPGARVHASGIPWDDASGKNLRSWLGVSDEQFYDPQLFGILPMGFCYPGTGKSGDLAPRKECAPAWHPKLMSCLREKTCVLLIGAYAQKYYLKKKAQNTLTETVKNYQNYLPDYFVLPHPSPRNNIWMKKNEWFARLVLPELKLTIQGLLP